ncbi:hypothetical protein PR202_ga23750 [Eleusine coracana subsp. coracana]|uniref:DUF7046 domain-containing protein n=1 Tax=Eleusine coracana subsp. coracana TaxID=191504 RepID=A0AAV5D6N8_ELECO|nr:hypothetical protein PR202_ga23750 [Eleusine coracana subsp. coracana]
MLEFSRDGGSGGGRDGGLKGSRDGGRRWAAAAAGDGQRWRPEDPGRDDPETKELIKRTLEIGHVTYEIQVQLPVRFLDMWEPAVLAIKREGYSIKCNGQRGVVITEKFQQATVISIPSGSLSEFSITSADGVDYDLKPAENTLSDFASPTLSFQLKPFQLSIVSNSGVLQLRDTIVLVLRLFKNMTALIPYGFHDIWCTVSQKPLLSLTH